MEAKLRLLTHLYNALKMQGGLTAYKCTLADLVYLFCLSTHILQKAKVNNGDLTLFHLGLASTFHKIRVDTQNRYSGFK